jgi:hypothetical protein
VEKLVELLLQLEKLVELLLPRRLVQQLKLQRRLEQQVQQLQSLLLAERVVTIVAANAVYVHFFSIYCLNTCK